jgi:hypothetical protein
MSLLIANFDREQFFRPVTFGPDGTGGRGVFSPATSRDMAWSHILAALMLTDADPSWAGDRVAVLRPCDNSNHLLTGVEIGLCVLAGSKVTNYQYALEHFTDVTNVLLKDALVEAAIENEWYERLFQEYCFKQLTHHHATLLLAEASREFGDNYDGFLKWLSRNHGLKPDVQNLVEAELAGVNPLNPGQQPS